MKSLIPYFLGVLVSAPVFATTDVNDRAYIVVRDTQDQDVFFVERVPILGCRGIARGAQLIQFTSEYKATSNVGCGGEVAYTNINSLTCAKVTSYKESEDFLSFSEVTLDISKCEAKKNPKFLTMVRTAAKLNFPHKKGEVKLVLVE
jgi:hypothetical protein